MINLLQKICLSILLLIGCLFFVRGQSVPQNLSLFVVQCKTGEGACYTQEIVRYNFKNGEFYSKEAIISLPTNEFRFDLGGNQIYLNRYLLGGSGGIFDTQTKQVLGDGRGQLADTVGNDVIFEVNRTDLEGFFAFNLETRKYRKLPSPNFFESGGKLSPNKKRFVKWKNSVVQSAFIFHDVENWKSKNKTTVKGNFFASCSERCSSGMTVPFEWIDDERILTQKSNGEIVSINVNGRVDQIVKIKIDEVPDSLPFFEKDKFGNFSYYCSNTRYSIDVTKRTYTKDKSALGNEFERKEGKAFWKEYYYKGASIGRVWSGSALTYKGYLAIEYAKDGKNLGYPDGLKIWNEIKKDWITIEIDWLSEIVGWVKD